MRSRHTMSHSIPRNLVVVALIFSCHGVTPAQSHTQSIYLPDPTPRPPDLHREYGDDPVERAKLAQAAKLQKLIQIQQVVSATNSLSVLAQELKNDVDKHDRGAPMTDAVVKAEEIEKLAKKVKDTMKSH
jgi:hypothetical protein